MVGKYSTREQTLRVAVALVGALGLNGVFIYALVMRPELIGEALRNPVSLAFIAEAFVVMGLLAYFLGRWGVARRAGVLFIVLSLLGGIAFALPVVMLWRRGGAEGRVP
jgi:hypothetical protein